MFMLLIGYYSKFLKLLAHPPSDSLLFLKLLCGGSQNI